MAGKWTNPYLSVYTQELNEFYTRWLYGDKHSNKYYNQPDKWPEAGQVQFVDRSMNFTAVALAAGTIVRDTLNLGGGMNVIVFSRVCTVKLNTVDANVGTIDLAQNQLPQYVNIQEIRKDDVVAIETTPINNVFGYTGAFPHIFPVPEAWMGGVTHQITVTNNTSQIIDVNLSWKIAYLNQGR